MKNCGCGEKSSFCYISHHPLVDCFSDMFFNKLNAVTSLLNAVTTWLESPNSVSKDEISNLLKLSKVEVREIVSFIRHLQYIKFIEKRINSLLSQAVLEGKEPGHALSCKESVQSAIKDLFSIKVSLGISGKPAFYVFPEFLDETTITFVLPRTSSVLAGDILVSEIPSFSSFLNDQNFSSAASLQISVVDVIIGNKRECDGIRVVASVDVTPESRKILDYLLTVDSFISALINQLLTKKQDSDENEFWHPGEILESLV
jgi:hypothetical protein